MKLNELLSLDIEEYQEMTNKEIKAALKVFADNARKRVKRLEKTFGTTPAVEQYYQGGGSFKRGGKTKQSLLNEIQRALSFFESPTSTIRGSVRIARNAIEVLEEVGGINNIPEKDFWRMYKQQLEQYPQEALESYNYPSSQIITQAYDLYLKGNKKEAQEVVKNWYENRNLENWGFEE